MNSAWRYVIDHRVDTLMCHVMASNITWVCLNVTVIRDAKLGIMFLGSSEFSSSNENCPVQYSCL
jgi:hypothetical protein